MAYGTPCGGVGLVVVTESLRSVPTRSGFGADYTAEVLHEVCDQQPSAADGSGITALSWVEMLRENVKEFSFSSCTLLC